MKIEYRIRIDGGGIGITRHVPNDTGLVTEREPTSVGAVFSAREQAQPSDDLGSGETGKAKDDGGGGPARLAQEYRISFANGGIAFTVQVESGTEGPATFPEVERTAPTQHAQAAAAAAAGPIASKGSSDYGSGAETGTDEGGAAEPDKKKDSGGGEAGKGKDGGGGEPDQQKYGIKP